MQPTAEPDRQRGFFAVGAEGISKAMNLGTLTRTAHAFGASYVFLVGTPWSGDVAKSDTSRAEGQLPIFSYADAAALTLPRGCRLVGVELVEDAVALPSFRHPRAAAYVLGPERGSLSAAMQARCDHLVRIPTRFCVNLGVAAAIVMYDRMVSLGRFAERPVAAGGPVLPPPPHVHGGPRRRRRLPNDT